ncbi:hypothetical protein BDZ94DRAFT_1309862 [Collybia nuda]|uniref:Uncharacterized protein n=1 Tax=Collybia nuda TaxID=64659 RepID=A0A9P6CDX4_9AGAR|nr:hypothetical protein BDZ94DRAFT_1309862 [Collybia nuda]
MTSIDSALLTRIGQRFMLAMVQVSAFTLVYGVFLLLFGQAVSVYLKRTQRSRAHSLMFLTSSITFILATIMEVTLLAEFGILIDSDLIGHQDLPLKERLPFTSNRLLKPGELTSWLNYILASPL